MQFTLAGKYVVEEDSVNVSGQSIIFEAKDKFLDRKCILKILKNPTPDAKERFMREARILAQVSHPGTCSIYEYFEITRDDLKETPLAGREFEEIFDEDGKAMLISEEHANGTVLERLIDMEKFLTREGIVNGIEVLISCSQTLRDLLKQGIVHRDIKPSNIFVREDFGTKIIDFGIALLKGGRRLTDGFVVGTLHYMSPEQLAGSEIDERTDMYALGVVAYEMFTKVLPVKNDANRDKVARSIIADKPIPPNELNRNVPDRLNGIIMRLLEKRPADRYKTYTDLISELHKARADLTGGTGALKKAALIIPLIIAAVFGAWFFLMNGDEKPGSNQGMHDKTMEVNDVSNPVYIAVMDALNHEDPELAKKTLEHGKKGLAKKTIDILQEEIDSMVAFKEADFSRVKPKTVAAKIFEDRRKSIMDQINSADDISEFIAVKSKCSGDPVGKLQEIQAELRKKQGELEKRQLDIVNSLIEQSLFVSAEKEYNEYLLLVENDQSKRDAKIETAISEGKNREKSALKKIRALIEDKKFSSAKDDYEEYLKLIGNDVLKRDSKIEFDITEGRSRWSSVMNEKYNKEWLLPQNDDRVRIFARDGTVTVGIANPEERPVKLNFPSTPGAAGVRVTLKMRLPESEFSDATIILSGDDGVSLCKRTVWFVSAGKEDVQLVTDVIIPPDGTDFVTCTLTILNCFDRTLMAFESENISVTPMDLPVKISEYRPFISASKADVEILSVEYAYPR